MTGLIFQLSCDGYVKVGVNSLNNMMPIPTAKILGSPKYTNHCIRSTGRMKSAEIEDKQIIGVTGHKTIENLDRYNAVPSMKEKTKISNAILGVKDEKEGQNQHPNRQVIIPRSASSSQSMSSNPLQLKDSTAEERLFILQYQNNAVQMEQVKKQGKRTKQNPEPVDFQTF